MLGLLQSLFDGTPSNTISSSDIIFSTKSPKPKDRGEFNEEHQWKNEWHSTPSPITSMDSSSPENLIVRVESQDLASNIKSSGYNSEKSFRREVPHYSSGLSELFRSPPSNWGRDSVSYHAGGRPSRDTPRTPNLSRTEESFTSTIENTKSAPALFFLSANPRSTSTYSSKLTRTTSELLDLAQALDDVSAETSSPAKLQTPRVACNECYKWKDLWKEVVAQLDAKKKELNSISIEEMESLKEKLASMESSSKAIQEENIRLKGSFSKNEKRLEFFETQIKNELKGEVEDGQSKSRSLETQLKIIRGELADSRETVKATNKREQEMQVMLLESQKDLRRQQTEFANTTTELEAHIATLEKKFEAKIMENSNYHIKLAEMTCQWHTLINDNCAQQSRLQLLENSYSNLEQEHALKIVKLETGGNSTQGQDLHGADAIEIEDKQQINSLKAIAKAKIEMCSKCKQLLNEAGLPSVDNSASAAKVAAL